MNQIALVYARASNDPTDQRISVDRQVKLCSARAHDLWPTAEVRVFRDDSITAADPTKHRPGFAAFLAAVRSARKGELVGIVVNEQSRLTRQGEGAWDELVVTLTRAGVTKVETLRNGPISVEPGNRLVGRMLAVVDAEEVERTKARVSDAHRELYVEGRPAGRPPFGYRAVKDDDGRPAFEIDTDTGPIVERIYSMALDGHAVSAIVAELNADEVPPPGATLKFKDGRKVTRWTPGTLRSLLTCPTYAGLRGHRDETGELHTTPGRWPHLIDPDRWQQVQRLLGQPSVVTGANGQRYRVRTAPKAQPRKFLLSGGRRRPGTGGVPGESYGVLRCGKCGSPMVAQSQRRAGGVRVSGYACHRNSGPDACCGVSITPADEIDKLVVAAMQARLATSSRLRKRLSASDDAEVGKWRVERDRAKARMIDASTMFGAGDIDRDSFDAMHAPAKAAHEHAEARLAAMTTDTTLPSIDDVTERWDSLTLRQQRAVVERLIDSIVIAPRNRGVPGFNRSRVGAPKWRA
jgi:DNA invertase Pin-like site-specific DNA recombinase